MLWSQDLTCFYNYTLSAILCASFVIHSISYGGIKTLFTKSPIYKKAILVIWLYFAIFSNLFSSVILAAYIGAELVSQLFSSVTGKTFDLKEYCSNNAISLFIILFWFLSNIIETTGGRADDIGKSTLTNISSTFVFALINFVSINVFITILGIVIGFLWIRKCGRFDNVIAKCVLYFLFTIIYLLVLSATAEPYYIYRAEIVIDILFFLFICLIAAFNELIRKNRNYFRLVYILAGTTVLLLIHPGKVFYSYNNSNASYKQCEALINDIISQFHDAEESGATELTLVVPAYDVIYNWPLADFAGDNIATALYHHNITQSYISVKEITPSRTKNALFNISEFDLEKNLKEVYSVLLVE